MQCTSPYSKSEQYKGSKDKIMPHHQKERKKEESRIKLFDFHPCLLCGIEWHCSIRQKALKIHTSLSACYEACFGQD